MTQYHLDRKGDIKHEIAEKQMKKKAARIVHQT
jgi:hypothetical protein